MMINEAIYDRLYKLIPNLDQIDTYHQLSTNESRPIGVDVFHRDDERIYLALSHYSEQQADSSPDLDMTVQVFRSTGAAEALSYHDMHRCEVVYPNADVIAGEFPMVNQTAKTSLDTFLAQWLLELLDQEPQ